MGTMRRHCSHNRPVSETAVKHIQYKKWNHKVVGSSIWGQTTVTLLNFSVSSFPYRLVMGVLYNVMFKLSLLIDY